MQWGETKGERFVTQRKSEGSRTTLDDGTASGRMMVVNIKADFFLVQFCLILKFSTDRVFIVFQFSVIMYYYLYNLIVHWNIKCPKI